MLTGHLLERLRIDDSADSANGAKVQMHAQAYTNGALTIRAFTLVEVVVVLSILTALMAMGFGGYKHLRENAAKDATRALVEAVANGIAARGAELSVRDGATVRSVPIWDVNRDGLIDGQGLDISGVTNGALLVAAGYAGLTPDVANVPERGRDTQGRPMDAWEGPLRYAYAPNRRDAGGGYARVTMHLPTATALPPPGDNFTQTEAREALDARFGSKGFVVWSAGPDGIDFNDDDIYAGF